VRLHLGMARAPADYSRSTVLTGLKTQVCIIQTNPRCVLRSSTVRFCTNCSDTCVQYYKVSRYNWRLGPLPNTYQRLEGSKRRMEKRKGEVKRSWLPTRHERRLGGEQLKRSEWSASRPGRALPPGKEPPVPTVQEAGWAPEPVWTQWLEGNSSACRGSNPGRPVRSQSLERKCSKEKTEHTVASHVALWNVYFWWMRIVYVFSCKDSRTPKYCLQ
jgi:hypothetical protein